VNELALFAGAGGGILGGKLLGWRTVGAVEIDPYCREILLRRQEEGILEPFPIWDEIRTFDGAAWSGCVDVITAGFPCQPFSTAGKRKGETDNRNMWPETIRVIREVGPKWCLLENVAGLLAHRYYGTILGELAEAGYDAEWIVLGADDAGAPHRRKRVWIVAKSASIRLERTESKRFWHNIGAFVGNGSQDVADSAQIMRNGAGKAGQKGRQESTDGGWWTTEPDMGRVADGVAYRVDRLKALGNGQVPAVVEAAWRSLELTMCAKCVP
jgi:DNA (cytosine-5)-methyltransferase 1